jgi:hypothetical protein
LLETCDQVGQLPQPRRILIAQADHRVTGIAENGADTLCLMTVINTPALAARIAGAATSAAAVLPFQDRGVLGLSQSVPPQTPPALMFGARYARIRSAGSTDRDARLALAPGYISTASITWPHIRPIPRPHPLIFTCTPALSAPFR